MNKIIWLGGEHKSRLEAEVLRVLHDRTWTRFGAHIERRMADHIGPKVWGDLWPRLRERLDGHVYDRSLSRDNEFMYVSPRKFWHHEWETPFRIASNRPYQLALFAYRDAYGRLGGDLAQRIQLYDHSIRVAPCDGLTQVARSAGWWYPLEHVVVLTERPSAVHLDQDGRLHNPDGPAVVYPDGFAVHARHGTVVPAPIMGLPIIGAAAAKE